MIDCRMDRAGGQRRDAEGDLRPVRHAR